MCPLLTPAASLRQSRGSLNHPRRLTEDHRHTNPRHQSSSRNVHVRQGTLDDWLQTPHLAPTRNPPTPHRHSDLRQVPAGRPTHPRRRPPYRYRPRRLSPRRLPLQIGFNEDFGDCPQTKPDGVARLLMGNLGPQGLSPTDPARIQDLRHLLQWSEADLFGGIEVNVNWKRIPPHQRLPELFRSENAIRTIAAHNGHEDNHSIRQYGGVCNIAVGSLVSRLHSQGADPTGLGRWVWQLFKGRNNVKTRIYTAYRPSASSRSQLSSVIEQHRRYFRSHQDHTCPRQAFLRDLQSEIAGRQMTGERVVVLMDANGDVTSGEIRAMLDALHLRDTILCHHPDLPAPATHQRGSQPIDIIAASPEIMILSATWLSGDKSPGDHRLGMVDIPWNNLLGEDLLRVVRPPARRLTCTLPHVQRKYIALLDAYLDRHQVLSKLRQVQETRGPGPLSPTQVTMIQTLDKVRAEGMRFAEKRCRKLCMGEVDFSPAVIQAGRILDLWRLVWRRKRGYRVGSTRIRRLARRAQISRPLSVTTAEAEQRFREAGRAYRQLKPRASVLRYEFLRDRQDDPTLPEDDRALARQLLSRERQRESSRHLRRIRNRPSLGAIDKVQVRLPSGEVEEKHTQTEVEDAIMDTISRRYRLTESTPFLQEPLRSILGLTGTSSNAMQILEGSFICPESVDEVTQTVIQLLRRPTILETPVSSRISREDYVRYWSRAREATSSSFSGLHFGHWKAATHNEWLAETHSLFTEIVISSGTALPRWTTSLMVMLEKTPGVILVDKLRAILLMEADFNFANKLILGIRMMEQAEDLGLTCPETLGSRKHHDAKELALNRRLLTDISRQQVIPLAISSVDAEQCYDRQAHTPGSLCCQRLGAPPLAVASMLLTIQLMKFFLRTAYGDSSRSFGGDTNLLPFQGSLQGNGGGPAFWWAMSCVLVTLLHHRGHTSSICSALAQEMTTLAGLLFVDDTDLIAFGTSCSTPPATVAAALQEAVLTWQAGLHATGGALKPEKCSWGILAYYFVGGTARLHTKSTLPGLLQAHTPQGDLEEIDRKDPAEAIRVVGVMQALNGDMSAQVTTLEEKANQWAENIKNGWLNRRLAWHGLHSMIWPSLAYPLRASSISWAQGDKITRRLYRALLPELGLQRRFPILWRHAPVRYQGLALPHPYISQGIEHLKVILETSLSTELQGRLLRTSIEQAQLEIGTSRPILEEDYESWGGLLTPKCWIGCLWHFISTFGIKLQGGLPPVPPPQREGDQYLMEMFATTTQYSATELRRLNRCRLYARAFFLSDIVDATGRQIRSEYLQLTSRRNPPDHSKWQWPKQQPTNADWALWKAALMALSSPSGRLSTWDRLGDWIAKPHQHLPWRYDPGSDMLYQHKETYIYGYSRLAGITRRPSYRLSVVLGLDAPVGTSIARVRTHRTSVQLLGFAAARYHSPDAPTSIPGCIRSLEEAAWPLETSDFSHANVLAAAIYRGDAIGASDGSYMPNLNKGLGMAAWCLQDPASSNQCAGLVQTSGITSEVNAYRSELQGLHTMLLAVLIICRHYRITEGQISLACDNEKAIYLAGVQHLEVPCTLAHADLLRGIRRLIREIPVKVQLVDVAGHRDDFMDYTDLNPFEQLNCRMDDAAKKYLRELIRAAALPGGLPSPPSIVYGEGTRCIINGLKITSNPEGQVLDAMYSTQMRDYLHNKEILPGHLFPRVDWEAIEKGMSNRSSSFQAWMTKHVSGQCAVGRKMKLWGYWESDACPCCGEANETVSHLAHCGHPEMKTAFATQVSKLQQWLVDANTDPDVQDYFSNELRCQGGPNVGPQAIPARIHNAAWEQKQIGWDNLLRGRLSRHWRTLQEKYYLNQEPPKSADRWAADLCYHLLQFSHSLWTQRNQILHERDAQGLLLAEGQTLRAAIDEAYAKGSQALLPADQHLVAERTLASIQALTAADKYSWLSAIQLAHRQAEEERSNENAQMRGVMDTWLRTAE